MTTEIILDIESIPCQTLSRDLIGIAEQRCARKRGDNNNVDKFCSIVPEFGQIICIGLYAGEEPVILSGAENDILETFWALMFEHPNAKIVSFNGKKFDAPYIMKRSAILGIKPSMKISTRKYDTQYHYDCFEIISDFYDYDKMFNLQTCCKLYGIENSDNFSGGDVYALWKSGNLKAIEEHCRQDVEATWALYQKLKHYF